MRFRLRDGRTLEVKTLPAPSLGLSFFALPVQGRPQIEGYDHLDETGQVIESTDVD